MLLLRNTYLIFPKLFVKKYKKAEFSFTKSSRIDIIKNVRYMKTFY